MALPSIVVLRQLVRARLRQAAWGAAGVVAIAAAGVTAIGLAAAAGIVVTAGHIGVVAALLAWSGGLFAVILVALLLRFRTVLRRRRRGTADAPAAPAGDLGAALMSDIGIRAGIDASSALTPLGMVAAAFIVGALVARSGGRR